MLKLKKKGWSAKEISHLESIKKQYKPNLVTRSLIYVIISFAILTNFVVAMALVPFFILLSGWRLNIAVILLGMVFGLLYENIIDREGLSRHHYILVFGIVPAIAALFVIIFCGYSNYLVQVLNSTNIIHNSLMFGVVYGISFALPIAVRHIIHTE